MGDIGNRGIYEVHIIMIEDVMRKDVGKEFNGGCIWK